MQADLVVIDARALNLWPAHDPIAAALQASIANIEAVMIAGRWRKRDYRLVDTDIDEVKDRLQQSGERFAHKIRATGPVARAHDAASCALSSAGTFAAKQEPAVSISLLPRAPASTA
jgi:hypothetical protein